MSTKKHTLARIFFKTIKTKLTYENYYKTYISFVAHKEILLKIRDS